MRTTYILICILIAGAMAGCGTSAAPGPGSFAKTPEVSVSAVISEKVTDYEDFPGRLEAVNSIDIRARVTGFLTKFNFKEGSIVKKGEVLFEIDNRPYKAELDRTQGIVLQMEGRLKRLQADFARAESLLPNNAISKEDYDKIVGDRTEAEGNLKVAKANLDTANLKLDWTKVESPLTGRVSRRFIDPGNLVKEDETILTTIVDLNPIYAYFDLDERTALRYQKLIREEKIAWSTDGKLPVFLGLANEERDESPRFPKGFPRKGTIHFADNKVDPDTGTWRLRGLFANDDLSLTSGLFVRIRLPIGEPYQANLVSEQALGTDQGQKFVYVVKGIDKVGEVKKEGLSGTVDYRQVDVGRLHGGLRVISKNLKEGEFVIVSGLQRARPGMEVNVVTEAMPNVGNAVKQK
jgi:RND family efflux transporter MFP subunit